MQRKLNIEVFRPPKTDDDWKTDDEDKTTKSKIEKRLPDMKHNSEQKVEDNFRLPVFWQTPCCTFAL